MGQARTRSSWPPCTGTSSTWCGCSCTPCCTWPDVREADMEHKEEHVDRGQNIRPLVLTWAALMALLLLSAGSALLRLGWINTAIGLAIALVKAVLVAVIFMRLRRAHS